MGEILRLGAVIVMGGALALFLGLWYRARPGVPEASYHPVGALLCASGLIGNIPVLLWPEATRIQVASVIASIALVAAAVVVGVHRKRGLRRSSRQV